MSELKDVWKELLEQKGAALRELSASSHDNAKLRDLAEWLGRELDVEAKCKGLLSEAERLIAERQRPSGDISASEDGAARASSSSQSEWKFADIGKKERARLARSAYLAREKEKGNPCRKVGRIYYRNDEGIVIGITFSSDKGGGRWFLNLKENEFQEAVFLCQTGLTSVKAVRLPKTFMDRYVRQLGKDGKGEIKFNFFRDGERWLLEVPQPVGPIDVTSFVEREELVCARNDYQ